MGWSSMDEETVKNCKIVLSLTRKQTYALIQNLEKVVHAEKRSVLLSLSRDLYSKLDEIDQQLHR